MQSCKRFFNSVVLHHMKPLSGSVERENSSVETILSLDGVVQVYHRFEVQEEEEEKERKVEQEIERERTHR